MVTVKNMSVISNSYLASASGDNSLNASLF